MWVEDIEAKVFNVTKARLKNAIGSTYPNILFTSQVQFVDESQFPCVYMHMINAYEIGQDTERLTINGINATFQWEVYVNTTQNDCVTIMSALIDQIKKMGFSINGFPLYRMNGNVIYGDIRVSRVIGANDTL